MSKCQMSAFVDVFAIWKGKRRRDSELNWNTPRKAMSMSSACNSSMMHSPDSVSASMATMGKKNTLSGMMMAREMETILGDSSRFHCLQTRRPLILTALDRFAMIFLRISSGML